MSYQIQTADDRQQTINPISELAKAFRPEHLIAEMTSRCNLRCLYCQKALDEWNVTPGRDEDTGETSTQNILKSLETMPFGSIQLSGIGEFTARRNWVETLDRFLDMGLAVTLISNLAKPFSDEELSRFLRLKHLMVSIDTVDPDLLKKIRRSVSFATISTNLLKLRMLARKRRAPLPFIKLNAVLYVENLLGIEDLAYFAVENRVNQMQYERMYALTNIVPPTDLEQADAERATEALQQIETASRVLADAGVSASFHGDLIQVLEKRAGMTPQAVA